MRIPSRWEKGRGNRGGKGAASARDKVEGGRGTKLAVLPGGDKTGYERHEREIYGTWSSFYDSLTPFRG